MVYSIKSAIKFKKWQVGDTLNIITLNKDLVNLN